MGHTLNSDNDHQMLLQDQSRNHQESNLVTSSEIVVEFRHNISSSNRKGNDEIARVDIIRPQEFQETKIGEDSEAISLIKVKGKEPKKMVTIKENAGIYQRDSSDKQHQQQQKDKNILPISRDEPHSVKKHKVPRLLSVDTNINEKSDAFIRRKKAAMERELQH